MGKEEPKLKAKRHTPNQVIRKLPEAELMLAEGKSTAEVAKALEVSEVTFHRWRNQYGGMKADDAKRLKELERENTSLKRLVADKELEILAHKEISRGNFRARPGGERRSARCRSAFNLPSRQRRESGFSIAERRREPLLHHF
jgi:putative transposase